MAHERILLDSCVHLAELDDDSFENALMVLLQDKIIGKDQHRTIRVRSLNFLPRGLAKPFISTQHPLQMRDKILALDTALANPDHKLRFLQVLRSGSESGKFIVEVSFASFALFQARLKMSWLQKILPRDELPSTTESGQSGVEPPVVPLLLATLEESAEKEVRCRIAKIDSARVEGCSVDLGEPPLPIYRNLQRTLSHLTVFLSWTMKNDV